MVLSELVNFYFQPLKLGYSNSSTSKRIFCSRYQNSDLYINFFCTRQLLYQLENVCYENPHDLDPKGSCRERWEEIFTKSISPLIIVVVILQIFLFHLSLGLRSRGLDLNSHSSQTNLVLIAYVTYQLIYILFNHSQLSPLSSPFLSLLTFFLLFLLFFLYIFLFPLYFLFFPHGRLLSIYICRSLSALAISVSPCYLRRRSPPPLPRLLSSRRAPSSWPAFVR